MEWELTTTLGVSTATVRLAEPSAVPYPALGAIVKTTVWLPAARFVVGAVAVQLRGDTDPVQLAARAVPPSIEKLEAPVGDDGPV